MAFGFCEPMIQGVAKVRATCTNENALGAHRLYARLVITFEDGDGMPADLYINSVPGKPWSASYLHRLARAIADFNDRYEADQAAARPVAE